MNHHWNLNPRWIGTFGNRLVDIPIAAIASMGKFGWWCLDGSSSHCLNQSAEGHLRCGSGNRHPCSEPNYKHQGGEVLFDLLERVLLFLWFSDGLWCPTRCCIDAWSGYKNIKYIAQGTQALCQSSHEGRCGNQWHPMANSQQQQRVYNRHNIQVYPGDNHQWLVLG